MYTHSELRNIEAIRESKRGEIREQMAALEAKLAEVDVNMRMAATAQDKKAYIAAENEQRALEAQMAILHDRLADPAPVSRENVLAVWRDYADEYNQGFDKTLAAYKAARKKAAQLYMELAKDQRAALAERAYFARMLGGDPLQLSLGFSALPEMAALHLMENGYETRARAFTGSSDAQADLVCYILTGDLPRYAFSGMKQIIDNQAAADISPNTLTGTEQTIATRCGLTI